MVAQTALLPTFPTTQKPQRYKCPVHGGKKKSVAVWWNNGYRAFCHSHGCSQSDILAALGITNSQSIPWTPPPPRLRLDHQRQTIATCEPHTGVRLPFRYHYTRRRSDHLSTT